MEYEWILEFKSTGDKAKVNLHLRWSASSAFPCHWMSCVVAFDLPKMQNVQRIEDELIDVCLTAARKLDGLP